MRIEQDFLGDLDIPSNALFGIHSARALANFGANEPFHIEWYRATGIIKQACYETVKKFRQALEEKHPEILVKLNLPTDDILRALTRASLEVSEGKHFEYFIVPAIQGGAGTSINLNINEIITNRALQLLGNNPGEYSIIDPIETANIYQSTNDVIPTALKVSIMELLIKLEDSINKTRKKTELLEKKYRNTLRLSYTQLQGAVPSTYGILFSSYSDALSRDWWRVSKASERIKQINLGGGATGSGIAIPRFYIMEVGNVLRKISGLPLAQAENLSDNTSNLDSFVEVHAILKAHAVNMEKMVNDLRLLSSGLNQKKELHIPEKQTGSSIMPGKVNPVIPEFVISSAQRIFSNDQFITQLAAKGELELNAFLPAIGHGILQSIKLLIQINESTGNHLLTEIRIDEKIAASKLFKSPAVTVALSPQIGYNKAASIAKYMKQENKDIFEANSDLKFMPQNKLKQIMHPEFLLKKGFTISDMYDKNNE